ncbi:hypothetical protein KC360_g8390 [Hortaea werneckii]|nr:hypothetical protein KC325_g8371 [Hortaea werneckii]KAI6986697.1 hypothetical protein KC359_g8618 [Hortaea werneckii]KAI7140880.1 hypothetical protein KC344_g8395 [Hortaea werneckii]KAI7167866.1 hypothetical protein KC360_g8390 [Hortaea werneckii]
MKTFFSAWLKLWLSLPSTLLFAPIPYSYADEEPFIADSVYNSGDLGRYVTQSYKTTKEIAPRFNINLPFTNCDDGSYIFIAPRGWVPDATLYIIDAEGNMVWTLDKQFGEVYNFAVQEYKGEPYLTFWAGNDAVGGHGAGTYFMYDQSYQQYKEISGANDIKADLHSFEITRDDTAVASLYEPHKVNLEGVKGWDSDKKGSEGYVWDALFQEIDIETGEAIFQWRASDHLDFRESFVGVNKATHGDPWDFFHINTIEKDGAGNYLVSARHLRAVLYVSGETGEVLWKLGGKANSFEDLSDGQATSFVGQHDVHWFDPEERKSITMFDNGADWGGDHLHGSIGLKVGVDLEKMTTWVEQTYKHPEAVVSASQGSYQTLANGNVVLGYGFNGVVSEFDSNGTILCDAYFQPSSRFTSGDVQSYKNLKFNWTGWPDTDPTMALEDDHLWVSWMGATEVRSWMFEDSFDGEKDWRRNDLVMKKGFETSFSLADRDIRRYVRAVALDEFGRHLGSTNIDIGTVATASEGQMSHSHGDGEDADSEDFSEEEHVDKPEMESQDDEESEDDDDEGEEDDDDEDDDDDGEEDNDEDADEPDDFQLLAAFGFLAICSGALVAWMTWGRRGAWRKVSQEDDEERDIKENDNMNKMSFNTGGNQGFGSKNVGSALWERLPKPKWWKGGNERNQDMEHGGEMLSDLELSDSEERH